MREYSVQEIRDLIGHENLALVVLDKVFVKCFQNYIIMYIFNFENDFIKYMFLNVQLIH